MIAANTRRLYADIFWFGILTGTTITFISVFTARLGASGFQISLITAGPGLVNLILSLPAGRWLEKQPLHPSTVASTFWHRLGYFFIIPLPWLFAPQTEIWIIVGIILLMYIPGTLQAISFNSLFASLVPPERRGAVVGIRFAIQSLSTTAAALIGGQILDHLPFPLNYQILFSLGALAGMLSTYEVARLVLENDQPFGKTARSSLIQMRHLNIPALLFRIFQPKLNFRNLSKSLRLDLMRTSFAPFILSYLVFYFVQYVPIPLFPLISVRTLQLSDGEISVANALFYGSMFLGAIMVSRLNQIFTHRQVLVASGSLIMITPLLYGIAQNALTIWIGNALGGLVWSGVSTGLISRLMERVPAEDRPAHMAWHNLVLNVGMLCGSLCGPWIMAWIGLRPAMLSAAGLRVIASILLLILA